LPLAAGDLGSALPGGRLLGVREALERPAPLPFELDRLLRREGERAPFARDLAPQLAPAPAAGAPAERGQSTFRRGQSPLGAGAQLLRLPQPRLKEAQARALPLRRRGSCDDGAGSTTRARSKRSLLARQPLGPRFLERLREARERVALVQLVEVALRLPDMRGDVEARLRAGAR